MPTSLPLRVHPFYAESSYSREEVIATIQVSYELLIKLPYIEPNALVFAPPKGWSGVHAEELRPRGNMEEVMEMLQHLPYLRAPYHLATSQWIIMPFGCTPSNSLLNCLHTLLSKKVAYTMSLRIRQRNVVVHCTSLLQSKFGSNILLPLRTHLTSLPPTQPRFSTGMVA